MGTIRREVGAQGRPTPQRPDVRRPGSGHGMNPDWLVGFVDGEGCFHVGVSRHPEMRFGAQILPEFTVVQHMRDVSLLHRIRSAMGCGVVRRNHGDRYCWRVRDLRHLADIIVPFFERHPLRSRKQAAFSRWARIVRRMARGDHQTQEGFDELSRLALRVNQADGSGDDQGLRESPCRDESRGDA